MAQTTQMARMTQMMGMISIMGLLTHSAGDVWAAGKKPTSLSPAAPAFTTPDPIRNIRVLPVNTTLFHLPNGRVVDMGAQLDVLNNTAITDSAQFQPVDGTESRPCQTHFELRSAVTIFEMDMVEMGFTFGFSPSGSLPIPVSANGKVNVKLGTISMDFSLWKCVNGECASVAAVTADQLTSKVALSFELDLSVITAGPSLIYNTPLGQALQAIMLDGINKLSQSIRVNELPWQAEVKLVDGQQGSLTFNAGFQDRIAVNQAFEIYAPVDSSSSGMCNVFQVVGYAHTSQVDSVSSVAQIDQLFGSRGILPGDVVMIHVEK